MSCTQEALAFLRPLVDSDIEKMIVLLLDVKNRITGLTIFPGTVNCAVIHPREVVKAALLAGASAIILCHNHPSGDVKPSDADRKITRSIKDACGLFDIPVHDHLILAEKANFSFREEGIL